MELLPKDEIKAMVLGDDPEEDEEEKQEGLLDNMFIMVVLVVLCTLLIILVLIARFYFFKRLPQALKKVLLAIQAKLMFNSVLRSTIQSYLKMSIATSAAFFTQGAWLTTIGFTIWLLSYPVLSYFILKKQSKNLNQTETR
jgi:hypothetical protein